MNNENFTAVVDNRITKIRAILVEKAKEYSSDSDRLHNFKVAARISHPLETPEQALFGMLRKHLVSVLDIVVATQNGQYPSPEMRDEKLGDSINYLILLEALLIESSPPVAQAPLVVEGTCATLTYK